MPILEQELLDMMKMLNVVLIEDDSIYRAELESVIHFQAHLNCILSSPSAEHFREHLPARANIDIAFVDVDLPGESGISLLSFIAKRSPEAEIIMLTFHEEKEVMLQALREGATGYLVKDFSLLKIPGYIKTVLEGGAAISPNMARHLVHYFSPPKKAKVSIEVLTPKEEQVLLHLAEGKSYSEIAAMSGITLNGVRFHTKQIYKKLNVNNKIDAFKRWNS